MSQDLRWKTFSLLILTGIGLILLAAGLPDMQFQPGLPLPGAVTDSDQQNDAVQSTTLPPENSSFPVFPFGIGLTALLIVLVIRLAGKISLKFTLILFGGIITFLCLFILVNQIHFALPVSSSLFSQDVVTAAHTEVNTAPIGNPPPKIFHGVLIFLILLIIILALWFLYQILREKQRTGSIAAEASAALQSIETGEDPANVIIRCYLKMEDLIRNEKGIEREEFLTPREFAGYLRSKGIAIRPIQQLVELFEKVRYGNKIFDEQVEKAAIECLSEICFSSGKSKRKAE